MGHDYFPVFSKIMSIIVLIYFTFSFFSSRFSETTQTTVYHLFRISILITIDIYTILECIETNGTIITDVPIMQLFLIALISANFYYIYKAFVLIKFIKNKNRT